MSPSNPSGSPVENLLQPIRRLVLTAVSEPVEWIGKTGVMGWLFVGLRSSSAPQLLRFLVAALPPMPLLE